MSLFSHLRVFSLTTVTPVQTPQQPQIFIQQAYGYQQKQIIPTAPPAPPPTQPPRLLVQTPPVTNPYGQTSEFFELQGNVSVRPSQQQILALQPPATTPAPPFDCSGKPDGFYSPSGCQKTFVQCTNGLAFIATCQDTLFWNAERLQCDYAENTIACNPNARLSPRASTVVTQPVIPQPQPIQRDAAYNTCVASLIH